MRKPFTILLFTGSSVLILSSVFLIYFARAKTQLHSTDFTKLQSTISAELNRSHHIYYELDKKGHNYLSNISEKSEFEKMRISFLKKLNQKVINEKINNFSDEQINNFNSSLAEWNDYKYSNRANWYLKNNQNIEENFFQFSKDNPKIKAAWSFILLEEILSNEKNISKELNSNAAVIALVYYYKSINKYSEITTLIDSTTAEWIIFQCPSCR